jgi:hypothetical protein
MDAVSTHAELRNQLRAALVEEKGDLVTALIVSEAAALRERDAAETALRRHQSAEHGGGIAREQAM